MRLFILLFALNPLLSQASDPSANAQKCVFNTLTLVTNAAAEVDKKLKEIRPEGCKYNGLGDSAWYIPLSAYGLISKEAKNEAHAVWLRQFKDASNSILQELNCQDGSHEFTQTSIALCLGPLSPTQLDEKRKQLFAGVGTLWELHRKHPNSFKDVSIDREKILQANCESEFKEFILYKNRD